MKIGLLGLGTVGSGVYEIINQKRGNYFAQSKDEAVITKILVRDPHKERNIDIPSDILTENFEDILNDEEIQVVIFVMGGMEPEYTYMLQTMKKGKHVITANKAVVSEHMEELIKVSKENNVHFLFEASVGGGVPIISSLYQTLYINRISEIKGILNGTTNFILSKMAYEGWDFHDTLIKAQEVGFAEADPTADIEGFDISRKLSILSSIAFGAHIRDEHIYKRGIREVEQFDLKITQDMDYILKYLAHAILQDGNYYASVEPVLLPHTNIMSNVNEEFNIISIHGNIIGELNFYGKGAGKDATANAVVGDLLYIINSGSRRQEITLNNKDLKNGGIDYFKGKYYLRANTHTHEQFSWVLDSIDAYSSISQMGFRNKKIYGITQELSANQFNQLAERIASKGIPLFYARIHE